jgi:hypothetical protein
MVLTATNLCEVNFQKEIEFKKSFAYFWKWAIQNVCSLDLIPIQNVKFILQRIKYVYKPDHLDIFLNTVLVDIIIRKVSKILSKYINTKSHIKRPMMYLLRFLTQALFSTVDSEKLRMKKTAYNGMGRHTEWDLACRFIKIVLNTKKL